MPRDVFPLAQGKVPVLFWSLAFGGLAAGLANSAGWLAAGSGWLHNPAIAAMLLGGLPHGTCDISLEAATLRCRWRDFVPLISLYVVVTATKTWLWWLSPLAALLVFLGMSAIHLGEYWAMLHSGLLRAVAGMAVITTAAFGQQDRAADLFVALTKSPHAFMIARWAQAAAPLTWLVTLVGIEPA